MADYERNHVSTVAEPGVTLSSFSRLKGLSTYVIECHHAHTPCIGFAFFQKHKRLREEFKSLSKVEIGNLARSGKEVSEEYDLPLFIFLGDTTLEVFSPSRPISVLRYIDAGWKLIFVECSFISPDEIGNSIRTGHMHWARLKPDVLAHPDVTFVLIIFSRWYKKEAVDKLFDQ